MEGKWRKSPANMRPITAKPKLFVFFFAVTVAVLALLVAACGGGDDSSPTPEVTDAPAQILPVVISSDLAPGSNRFIVGLIDQANNVQIIGAQVHLRFFKLDGTEGTIQSEADATPVRLTKSFTHTHNDGTVESHEAGETGAYVATVEFDSAGPWAVQVTAEVDGQPIAPPAYSFTVREESISPAVGAPAPRSVQTILSDVAEITEIDTSDPPNPDMHNMTIADAVTSGKPTIIVFSTPAFCLSQLCGPTKQIVDSLYDLYQGGANFVHVEPYFLEQAREGKGLCAIPTLNLQAAREQWGGPDCPVLTDEELPPVDESWNLQSEPWVFLVDNQGNVAAKFETIVTFGELEAALLPLLITAGG